MHQLTAKGETSLYLAVAYHIRNPEKKDASCIHALYHAGVDINAVTFDGYTALQQAAVFGHLSLVQWLLSKRALNIGYPDAYMLAQSQGELKCGYCIISIIYISYIACCIYFSASTAKTCSL